MIKAVGPALALTLVRLLSHLPLIVLHMIGALLGWVVYALSPTYRRRLKRNLTQAGYRAHLRHAITESGKGMLELPFIWYAPPERVLRHVRIDHWALAETTLNAAKAANTGVIFLTPHLGCFEVTAQVIATKTPLSVLYRPPRKAYLKPFVEDARLRENLTLAPANLSGVRSLLKALKKGQAIGLLPDQVPGQGEGVWADFFHQPAYTMTLPAKLQAIQGAPFILVYAERLSWGRGYVVRFIALETLLGESPLQRARSINEAMEALIAHCPAQYLWSYHRYKTPKNAPSPSSP